MENKIKVIGNIYQAGVYYLETIEKKVLYVGSGEEMNDCLSRHLYFLKRGLYAGTNKEIVQKEYDKRNLVFRVVIEVEKNEDKEKLDLILSKLEQQHIKLNKKTICNSQQTVKRHSSNRSELSTYKRKIANRGSNNPNNRHDEQVIAEILWLKLNGYKPKQIEKYYENIKATYINIIGVSRWIHLEPVKPSFISENEKADCTAIQSANSATAIAQNNMYQ